MANDGQMLEKRGYGSIIVTVLTIVFVVGGFAIWQARPLYKWVQTQRAILMIGDIEECMKKERWMMAYQYAHEAYQMAPSEPKVLRAAANLAMISGSPEALVLLDKIVTLGEDTYEDRKMLAEANLRSGYIDTAEEINRRLLLEQPDDPDSLDLEVKIRLQRKDFPNAIRILKDLVKLRPEDADSRFLLAKLVIAKGSDQERIQGFQHLFAVAQVKGPLGIQAIDLLATAEGFSKSANELLIRVIREHPLAEERHLVLAEERSLLVNPEGREQIIADALQRLESVEPEERSEVFRWLSKEKEYALILDNLSFEEAVDHADLTIIYLNALGGVGRWKEAQDILIKEKQNLPIAEARHHIFAALCAEKLGEGSAAMESHLQKAMRTAKRRGSYLEAYNAGLYAEGMGMFELAELAYELAHRSTVVAEKCYQGLIRVAEKQKDAGKLRDITQRYHWRFPHRSDLAERVLYLNALLGIEVETTLDESLQLVHEEPYRNTPRIIAALAYLRLKNLPKAAETCGPVKVNLMSDGEKAVYAAVVAASENTQLASEISGSLPTDELFNEEKALIKSFLTPPSATNTSG